MSVRVRYFAGARAAAGTQEETVEGTTLLDVLATVAAAHPGDLERVLGISSFLVDGESTTDPGTVLDDGQTLDVLPPFAGG